MIGLGGTVYGLPAGRVVVSPLRETTREALLLVCDTCRTQLPAATATVDQLDGAPCSAAVQAPSDWRIGTTSLSIVFGSPTTCSP